MDPSDLDNKIITYISFLPDHEPEVIEDEWSEAGLAHRVLDKWWVGYTTSMPKLSSATLAANKDTTKTSAMRMV